MKGTHCRYGGWLLVLWALAAQPAVASSFPAKSDQRPHFVANILTLPAPGDSIHVDLFWEVPFRELTFNKEPGWFRAFYDVAVVFEQRDRPRAGDVWERRVRTRTFRETLSREETSKGRKRITLASGKYDVRVTLTDRRTGRKSRIVGELDERSGGARIGLSDPRMVRHTPGGSSHNTGNQVPVGESGHVVRFLLYAEEEAQGPCRIEWKLSEGGRGKVAEGDTTIVVADSTVTVELKLPSERLNIGPHQWTMRARSAAGDESSRRTISLFARLTAEWFFLHREDALDVLRILASGSEMDRLENAEGDSWSQELMAFWNRHDPDPLTPGNEFREAIQTRMEQAAALFREPFLRPGWRTDRGRVMLLYGEPARRTIRHASLDGPGSEFWEYESPSRSFLFVDVRGSGEFWLRS